MAEKAILITGLINAEGRVWWSDGTWSELRALRFFDVSSLPKEIEWA